MARRFLAFSVLLFTSLALACGGGGGGSTAAGGSGGGGEPVRTATVRVRVPVPVPRTDSPAARALVSTVSGVLYSEGLATTYGTQVPLDPASPVQTVQIDNVPLGRYLLQVQSLNDLGQPVGQFTGPLPVTSATQEVQVTLAQDPAFGAFPPEGPDQALPPFRRARSHPANHAPAFVATADFDGDGRPDAVTSGSTPNGGGSLGFFQGLAGGGFAEPRNLALPGQGGPVAAADFDGDGRPDVACVSSATQVLILLNQGGFAFAPPRALDLGETLISLAAGAVDGGAQTDLVAVGRRDGPVTEVVALLGQGDGTFQSPVRSAFPSHPFFDAGAPALADFNGDGRLDVASCGSYSGLVHLMLSLGNGSFRLSQSAAALTYGASGVAAGDFDGDHLQDLAVGSRTGNNPFPLVVLLGRGDGTVQAPTALSLPENPTPLLARDFDRDGRDDLVVGTTGRGLYLFRGAAGGLSSTSQAYRLGNLSSAVSADLDLDGAPDVLAADGPGCAMMAVTTALAGSFQLPRLLQVRGADQVGDLALGDLDGDGFDDLAALANPGGTPLAFTMRSLGNGTFLAGQSYGSAGSPHSTRLLDVNLDGKLDYASDMVLLGAGDGTLVLPPKAGVSSWWGALRSGDLDGDGRPDLVGTSGLALVTGLGRADGSFQPTGRADLARFVVDAAVGDFDGDGRLDAAGLENSDNLALGAVRWARGRGDGTLEAPQLAAAAGAEAFAALEAGDFDGDGRADLAASLAVPDPVPLDRRDRVRLYRSLGGSFEAGQEVPVGRDPSRIRCLDVNGDGRLDLVVVNRTGLSASILRGRGDGTMEAAETVPFGCPVNAVAAGDVNGDGKLDLVGLGQALSVLLGR